MKKNALIFLSKTKNYMPWNRAESVAEKTIRFMEENPMDNILHRENLDKKQTVSLRLDMYHDWLSNPMWLSGTTTQTMDAVSQFWADNREVYLILHDAFLEENDFAEMYDDAHEYIDYYSENLAEKKNHLHFVLVETNENLNYTLWPKFRDVKDIDISLIMPKSSIEVYKAYNNPNPGLKYYTVNFAKTSSEYERALIVKNKLNEIIAKKDKKESNQKHVSVIREKQEQIKQLRAEIAQLKKQR